ncbi:MAG: class I poly(R)-hydroxyalkanoic acid synthase [Rhodomicrobium sp.]|nr:MAG: class I poly(R)-hydroxyalkanoic acid synthase [Rhodomicrobium sp.]
MNNKTPSTETHDLEKYSEAWFETINKSRDMALEFMQKQHAMGGWPVQMDERAIKAFHSMAVQFATDPTALATAQLKFWSGLTELWVQGTSRMAGLSDHIAEENHPDRRFKHEAWEKEPAFEYMKETYLFVSDWLQNLSEEARGLSPEDRKKIQFNTRQFASAISPTNFVWTNPEVLEKTVETGGENLLHGFQNLLSDMERGKGKLKISMTDQNAFTVGKNIAATKGKVVFRNQLFELIQYSPTTEKVHKTPILFVPPWINKFYVLDLKPENSLIKWVVDKGYTLFVISWVNPDKSEADIGFADYMRKGVLVALDEVLAITKEEKVNLLGFCIGGILLTTTLAYLAAKGDERVNSATLLATMINLSDAGEMSVFVDDEQLQSLQQKVQERGYMAGEEMSGMFNMMRENDLVWSFVVNNYLMGHDPVPFDLLYWNADSTRMPAKMIIEYLTDFYRDNAFMNKGRLVVDDTVIDVSNIETPVYMVATKDDHIAPWKACYEGNKVFSGKKKFVLGASGHIAGIVNPPGKKKYCYWTNKSRSVIENPDEWMEGAKMKDGSWWDDWEKWLSRRSGELIKARRPGGKGRKALANAPGTYVLIRSD